MRHINIPIFIPHLGCPNQCIFCNQRFISGTYQFDESVVDNIINQALTTIDKDVQDFCDSISDSIQSGAVVVADARNGEILALSSYPSFDADNIAGVLDSDKGELINRAEYSFTPGSVFKIVVALSALEKDLSLYNLEYTCTGEMQVENDVFRCHKHSGHGICLFM